MVSLIPTSLFNCRVDNEDFVPHGQAVVDYFRDDLELLETKWRQHFLNTMQPQFMPKHWSLHHNFDERRKLRPPKRNQAERKASEGSSERKGSSERGSFDSTSSDSYNPTTTNSYDPSGRGTYNPPGSGSCNPTTRNSNSVDYNPATRGDQSRKSSHSSSDSEEWDPTSWGPPPMPKAVHLSPDYDVLAYFELERQIYTMEAFFDEIPVEYLKLKKRKLRSEEASKQWKAKLREGISLEEQESREERWKWLGYERDGDRYVRIKVRK